MNSILSAAVILVLVIFSSANALKRRPNWNLIVRGKNAAPGQFPYQISLRENQKHICGGSIISDKYILTAAHCVLPEGSLIPYPATRFSIYAGSTNRLTGGEEIAVSQIKVHEKFIHASHLNDIAVLTLTKKLIFNKNIQPIVLENKQIPQDKLVLISGWGRLSKNGEKPVQLQYATLKTVVKNAYFLKKNLIDDSILMLGPATNSGACHGDSGGPAVYESKLAGVTGFGIKDCGNKYPDAFAKVSHHIEWIEKNTI